MHPLYKNHVEGIFFDDASNRVIAVHDHPVDHIEPIEPPEINNEKDTALAAGILFYLFPTNNIKDSVARLLCLAHRVLPELYNVSTKVKVAKILEISPQAVNQMMLRADHALARAKASEVDATAQQELPL